MKKTMTILAVLISTLTAFSQTEQGSFYIGGNTNLTFDIQESGFESDEFDYQKEIDVVSYNFAPSVGFFVIDNTVLGLTLPIVYTNTKDSNSDEDKTIIHSFNPFVRYYISTWERVNFFVEGELGFGRRVQEIEFSSGDTEKDENTMSQYKIGGGFAFFLNENISFNFLIKYSKTTIDRGDFGFGASNVKLITKGWQPGVGVSIYL